MICVADVFNLDAGRVAIIRVHFVGNGCLTVRCGVVGVCEAGGYLALEYRWFNRTIKEFGSDCR